MSPDQLQQMSPAVGAGIGIGILIVYIGLYLFAAFCLAKIAEKLGHPFNTALIMAIIPIANLILILQMAAKPLWWIILMLIPLVNIIIFVIVWMAICERRGKPKWWGILFLVPLVNLIIFLILAFGGEGSKPMPTAA